MRVRDMWKSSEVIKIMLVVVCAMFMSFGVEKLFSVAGILMIAGACWWAFRDGCNLGHQACAITDEIERIEADPEKRGAIDPDMYKKAYSTGRGLAGLLAGGLIGYAVNCVYIIMTLVKAAEIPLYAARFASFVVSLPFWSVVSLWQEDFVRLSPGLVVALMAGPFLIPFSVYLGYLRGPKLWAHTEEAMAAGRRRAKARSRIGANNRKRQPKRKQPEI